MMPVEVDLISRGILISVFLIGMLSGATVALIVSAFTTETRRYKED